MCTISHRSDADDSTSHSIPVSVLPCHISALSISWDILLYKSSFQLLKVISKHKVNTPANPEMTGGGRSDGGGKRKAMTFTQTSALVFFGRWLAG